MTAKNINRITGVSALSVDTANNLLNIANIYKNEDGTWTEKMQAAVFSNATAGLFLDVCSYMTFGMSSKELKTGVQFVVNKTSMMGTDVQSFLSDYKNQDNSKATADVMKFFGDGTNALATITMHNNGTNKWNNISSLAYITHMTGNLEIISQNLSDETDIDFSEKADDTMYVTISAPAGSFFYPAGGDITFTTSKKGLREQGIIDEKGNFINGSLSGNGFNLNDIDKDNDNDKKNDKDKGRDGQDGGNGDGSGNSSNNGGGTNPPSSYQPPTPPSKNPPSNGWDGGIKHAIDPVVLNLSEEGQSKSLENSFSHFDYDGDGFAEHTAWIGDKQGLLVVDINENGIIDDGSELLGEQTTLKNGRQAVDGYWALKDLNVIKDRAINSKDSSWSKIRVWIDNGDGITQEGELKTLDELGITSIKFNSKKITSTDAEDNKLKSIGFFTRSDGTTGEIRDYYFETDEMNTFNKTRVAISEEVAEELYLPESGKIESSWQIMMKSEDDSLKNLLRSYQNATDSNEKSEILDQILYTIAGNTEDNSSRGDFIDARKLNVIEKFYGSEYDGGKNPTKWTAPLILDLYGNIKRYYEGWISAQTTASDYIAKIGLTFNEETGKFGVDFSEVKKSLEEKISVDFDEGKKDLTEFTNAIHAIGFSDNIEYQNMCQEFIAENDELAVAVYSAGRNVIIGTDEKDSLHSNSSNSIILGGSGDDELTAHGKDVILIGGKGDDKLFGSRGDDYRYWGEYDGTETVNYIWNIGDGNDTITNTSNLVRAKKTGGTSYLRMGEGITVENLKFVRNETENAYIKNIDTDEEITVKDWFKDDAFKLDGVIFSDGSMLNRDELIENFSKFETTDGDDTLIGNSNNDTLDGGKGNDYLEGGKGDDIYIWGRGYGNDTINNTILSWAGSPVDSGKNSLVIKDLSVDEVSFNVSNNNLIVKNTQTDESLTVNQFFFSEYNQFDKILFDDGSFVTNEEVSRLVKPSEGSDSDDTLKGGDLTDDVIFGNDGNDKIYGLKGNDTLNGGSGNDYLEGGYGDDTYIYGRGYGNDTINNTIRNLAGKSLDSGNDKLLFNDEIKKEDVLWQSDKDDMLATIIDTEETLRIKNWFKDENNRIDEIIFSDGEIFNADDLDQCFQNVDSIVSENYCGVKLQKDSQIFAQNRF